jgi:large subunit ribosomal protein L30
MVVVRVRGHAKIQWRTVETMTRMKLTRVNHCVVLPMSATTDGMLKRVKDLLARMLFQRGEVLGGNRLTDSYVKENSKFTSILSFAKALEAGEAKISDVKGLKPVVRLPPPRHGYESTRRAYVDRGSLGYRGKDMEKLVDRMLEKPKEAK